MNLDEKRIAQTRKAVKIVAVLRLGGAVPAQIPLLGHAHRREIEQMAGVAESSYETWSIVYGLLEADA